MTAGDRYAVGAAVLFGAVAVFEIVLLATGRNIAGLSHGPSVLFAAVLALLCAAAAATLIVRARRQVLRSSVVLGWVATFALLAQGLAMRAARDSGGLAMLIAAMLSAILVQRAFTPLPWRDQGEPPARRRKRR